MFLKWLPKYTTPLRTLYYETPDRYKNSFYLSNASFFDTSNWFLHKGYETIFPTLVGYLREQNKSSTEDELIAGVNEFIKILDQCNFLIDVRYPIKRDDGSLDLIRGFKSNHGLYSGFFPSFGGLRMHPELTRDHMKGLAVLSTYRNASMGLTFSGAHGGIKIDPVLYSNREMMMILQGYVAALSEKGPTNGVMEPDINTNSRHMSWIHDTWLKSEGYNSMELHTPVVGKDSSLGGLDHFDKAGAQGAYFGIEYFLNQEHLMRKIDLKPGIPQKKFIIQGLGRMGSTLAKYLQNGGAKCVGVKEEAGYLYNPDGINVHEMIDYKNTYGTIFNYQLTIPVDDFEIYKKPCDLLILSARHKSIVCHMASNIQAKVIVEASYCPITPGADRTLLSLSKLVIPDIYICSGSAIAGYLEYWKSCQDQEKLRKIPVFYQNILSFISNQMGGSIQLVSEAVTRKLTESCMEREILSYVIEHVFTEKAENLMEIVQQYELGLDLRSAAYIAGIRNIFEHMYQVK